MKTRIIYEDEHILVAYKPAGLATQTAKVGQADMVSELKKDIMTRMRAQAVSVKADGDKGKERAGKVSSGKQMQQPYLGLVHRLDQPVEGLLVFGKNQKATAELNKQLGDGGLNKQYFAVVCGKPVAREGELVDYLIKNKDNCAQVVNEQLAEYADAKKAVLQYKILESLSTPDELALADIHIDTGRFHQIRVQMAHAGMPLLGDSKYGNAQTGELAGKLGVRFVALCAYKLIVKHPVTRQKMSFEIKPENKAFDFFLENNFGCDCLY